jgi:hypothetical protein
LSGYVSAEQFMERFGFVAVTIRQGFVRPFVYDHAVYVRLRARDLPWGTSTDQIGVWIVYLKRKYRIQDGRAIMTPILRRKVLMPMFVGKPTRKST